MVSALDRACDVLHTPSAQLLCQNSFRGKPRQSKYDIPVAETFQGLADLLRKSGVGLFSSAVHLTSAQAHSKCQALSL
jgi:hypothetical protein